MEKVSLYIPCYNAEKTIQECLDGIFRQSYKIDEVLIIDDCSRDGTLGLARRYSVRIISNKENKGLAACRNIAFKEARNEFVASLDADCLADPSWLGILMDSFEKNDIAGAGGKLIEKYTAGPANSWRLVHMPQHWGDEQLSNPDFLFGNNCVFKKSVLAKEGSFDERYRNNYEDVALSRALIKKGYGLLYIPAAVVYHLRKDSVKSAVTAFWNWVFFALPAPVSLSRLSRKILNNLKTSISFLGHDLRKGNFKLLWVDLFLFFRHSFLDWRYYRSGSLDEHN